MINGPLETFFLESGLTGWRRCATCIHISDWFSPQLPPEMILKPPCNLGETEMDFPSSCVDFKTPMTTGLGISRY